MKKTLLSILVSGLMVCSAHANEQDTANLDLLYKGANRVSASSEKSNEARQVINEQSKQTLITALNALADSDILKERIENNDQYVAEFSVSFLKQQIALKEALIEEAERLLLAPECRATKSCLYAREFITQANMQVAALKSSISKLSTKG